MSTKKKRSQRSTTEKAETLRRYFVDKVPISELCEQQGIAPRMSYRWVFYRWREQAMANLEASLAPQPGRTKTAAREAALEQRVTVLEARLAKKDSVIAEISEEYVELKKARGVL